MNTWCCFKVVALFVMVLVAYPICLNICTVYLPGHTKLYEGELVSSDTDFLHPVNADLISLLKLMWDDDHVVTQTCSDSNVKCLLMQVISKIGNRLNAGSDLEVLDMAIHNGTVEIQNEALMSLPIIVLYSGPRMLGIMFKKLE